MRTTTAQSKTCQVHVLVQLFQVLFMFRVNISYANIFKTTQNYSVTIHPDLRKRIKFQLLAISVDYSRFDDKMFNH